MFARIRKFFGLGVIMVLLTLVQPAYATIVNVEFQGFVDAVSPFPSSFPPSLFLPEGVITVGEAVMTGRYMYEFETAPYSYGYNASYTVSGSMFMDINGIHFTVPLDTVDVYLESYDSYHLSPGAFYFEESHELFSIKQESGAAATGANSLGIFLERIVPYPSGPHLLSDGIALPTEAVNRDFATRSGFWISKDTGDYSSRYTIHGQITSMENVEAVPEPATAALCGLGLVGMAGMRRIKRSK